jgi:putative membrane protein
MGMGWGIAMMVAMLMLVAVVVGGIVWLIVRLVRDGEPGRQAERASGGARQTLDRRYAAGEIDADEYRERRSTLDRGG